MTPKRFQNFYLHRESQWEEIPWLVPTAYTKIELRRPVVIINGAFDILHRTHMRLIFAAAHKAGTLICALDSDEKISAEKGPERPILNFIERATTLNYMPINYITEISSKADLTKLIQIVKPDLRVQGMDYKDKPSGHKTQKMLVREGSIHTSELIERIVGRYGSK